MIHNVLCLLEKLLSDKARDGVTLRHPGGIWTEATLSPAAGLSFVHLLIQPSVRACIHSLSRSFSRPFTSLCPPSPPQSSIPSFLPSFHPSFFNSTSIYLLRIPCAGHSLGCWRPKDETDQARPVYTGLTISHKKMKLNLTSINYFFSIVVIATKEKY